MPLYRGVVKKNPLEGGLWGLHTDDGFYKLPRPRPAISYTLIAAVDDFTRANGCTEVIPGSHLRGRVRELGRLIVGGGRCDQQRHDDQRRICEAAHCLRTHSIGLASPRSGTRARPSYRAPSVASGAARGSRAR